MIIPPDADSLLPGNLYDQIPDLPQVGSTCKPEAPTTKIGDRVLRSPFYWTSIRATDPMSGSMPQRASKDMPGSRRHVFSSDQLLHDLVPPVQITHDANKIPGPLTPLARAAPIPSECLVGFWCMYQRQVLNSFPKIREVVLARQRRRSPTALCFRSTVGLNGWA